MWRRLSPLVGDFSTRPLVPVVLALVFLLSSLLIGIQNDRGRMTERLRASRVQAEVLARSVAAPLAFDDAPAIKDYLSALDANLNIRAAGAYGLDGRLRGGFARRGFALPRSATLEPSTHGGDDIVWRIPVVQNGTRLGSVYLRYSAESLPRRASRYAGIAMLVVTAALLILALGLAYASLSRAHRELREETAQRQIAEEALRQSQKMEAMGQLTGGVAHDFNNLLMVASGGLDLLDRTDDPDRRERLKAGIRQAIDRGAKLTQQLLTFARRSPMKPEVLDVASTVRGLQDMLDRALREDIRVEMAFAADLCAVEVDRSQFEVAVLNVALNARDAMPEGGTIRIGAETIHARDEQPAMIRVFVTDQGVGVSPENLQKVFEPFFTTKGVGQGTGLGLSQVYGFARAAGGDVRFDSEVGKGSTVAMLLPCSAKTLAAAVAPARAIAAANRRCRLLLVEDDDQVAALVGEMLGELGYDFDRVAHAQGGLDRLASGERYDLVFTDMVMPGAMGGLELAREIERRWPGLKVVLTSGYSHAASAAVAEGRDILTKPYSMQALGTKLSEALKTGE